MGNLIKKSIKMSTGGMVDLLKKPKKIEPRVMPDPDDEAIRLARKRAIAEQRLRSGRASTILSDTSSGGFGG